MKKLILVSAIISVLMFGCGKPDEVSQKMIDDIDSIGEVTLDKEEEINKLYDRYNSLTDKQKDSVNNYIDLINAMDEIENQKEAYALYLEEQAIAEAKAEEERLLEEKRQKIIAHASGTYYIENVAENAGLGWGHSYDEAYMVYDVDKDNEIIYFKTYYGSEAQYFTYNYYKGDFKLGDIQKSSKAAFDKLVGEYQIAENLTCNKEDVLEEGAILYFNATSKLKGKVFD